MRATIAGLVLLGVLQGPTEAFDRFVNPNATCPLTGVPQHTTIQEAVDNANPGDAIGVCPGTYPETVTITASKNGISLTALGRVLLTQGDFPGGIGVIVLANDVRIERFRIRVPDFGIVVGADRATIQHNRFSANDFGIIMSGDGHRIRSNIINAAEVALAMHDVNDADVFGNRLSGARAAITASNLDQTSHGTVIHHNLVRNPLSDGIVVSGAGGGTIRNNTVRTFENGILVSSTNGVVIEQNLVRDSFGVTVQNSTNCAVGFNSAAGLTLSLSEGCTIVRNNVSDCFWDGLGANTFSRNACGTESPPGAWD